MKKLSLDWWAVLVAIAAGVVIGLINTFFVMVVGVQSIVVTLGSGTDVNLTETPLVVDVNVRLVWRAKEVVIVSHHFLVGADQHKGQVISFARHKCMQLENVFDVMQIDKLIDDAV